MSKEVIWLLKLRRCVGGKCHTTWKTQDVLYRLVCVGTSEAEQHERITGQEGVSTNEGKK